MKKRLPTSILAFCMAAGGILIPPDAFAGPKELALLNAKLGPKNLANATADEIAIAVDAAISENLTNKKIKIGAIAGEALKGAADQDAGSAIGGKLAANPAFAGIINTIAADAAVNATTGTGADGSLVPDFIEQIVGDNLQATTIAAAAAKKSKTAIGAIIGGRAQEIATDGGRIDLANQSIANTKLSGGAQSITQYVGNSLTAATSIASFASTLASAKPEFLTSIAPGAVASDPSQARNILDALFTGVTASAAANSASRLAAGMSLAAGTEQVEQMAESFGLQIGSGTSVKATSINAIAKALIEGIIKRPTYSIADTVANKMDEIGEVGAYLLAGAINNPDFDKIVRNKGKAASIVTSLIKTIITAAKDKANPTLQIAIARDVAGSIALTLKSLGATPYTSSTIYDQIVATLTNPTTARKILGARLAKQTVAGTPLGTLVATALADGIGNLNGADGKYEDGTITEDDLPGQVVDPVTDIRNG